MTDDLGPAPIAGMKSVPKSRLASLDLMTEPRLENEGHLGVLSAPILHLVNDAGLDERLGLKSSAEISERSSNE